MPDTEAPSNSAGQRSQASLAGLRVVEFDQIIAGPMAGTLLADLGAEVIHIELPGVGEAGRSIGPSKEGTRIWWTVLQRNKRFVTLDLRLPEGQELARRLVQRADVVIANFKPATLEAWGLDYDTLLAVNPRLVFVGISGFGSDTTKRNAPGFGKVGEAMSGLVHLTGFPDGPPTHPGLSLGDATAGLMGSFGALAALYRRAQDPDFAGEFVDVALFEALFRLIDWHVPVYDQLGEIPIRNGNRPIVAPGAAAGMYRTREGAWITVSSATLRSVLNVVRAVGLPEAEYQTWDQQMANHDVLDGALRDWVAERSLAVCLQELHEAEAVAERVFTAEDICNDETYRERGDIVSVDHPQLGAIRMPAALPKMRNHPGSVWRPGVELGADNELVYGQWLGLSAQERSELASRGVI